MAAVSDLVLRQGGCGDDYTRCDLSKQGQAGGTIQHFPAPQSLRVSHYFERDFETQT